MSTWHSVIWTCWDQESSESTGWSTNATQTLKAADSLVHFDFDKRVWIGWVSNVDDKLDEDFALLFALDLEACFRKRLARNMDGKSNRVMFAELDWHTHKRGQLVCCWCFAQIRSIV